MFKYIAVFSILIFIIGCESSNKVEKKHISELPKYVKEINEIKSENNLTILLNPVLKNRKNLMLEGEFFVKKRSFKIVPGDKLIFTNGHNVENIVLTAHISKKPKPLKLKGKKLYILNVTYPITKKQFFDLSKMKVVKVIIKGKTGVLKGYFTDQNFKLLKDFFIKYLRELRYLE